MAYFQSRGIPALADLCDSCMGKIQVTHGQSAPKQWLAAAEAIHVAMLVSFRCGYFLVGQEVRPETDTGNGQRYLGKLYASDTTTFRAPRTN